MEGKRYNAKGIPSNILKILSGIFTINTNAKSDDNAHTLNPLKEIIVPDSFTKEDQSYLNKILADIKKQSEPEPSNGKKEEINNPLDIIEIYENSSHIKLQPKLHLTLVKDYTISRMDCGLYKNVASRLLGKSNAWKIIGHPVCLQVSNILI